jgi:hypothetical protein
MHTKNCYNLIVRIFNALIEISPLEFHLKEIAFACVSIFLQFKVIFHGAVCMC